MLAVATVSGALAVWQQSIPYNITFDDIRLTMKPQEKYQSQMLTEKVQRLDGKSVCITGYMSPSTAAIGRVTRFVMERDVLR
jgi:hypothetical protein